MSDKQFSYNEISEAINRAASDVEGEIICSEERTTDQINLVVNAALHYLTNPDSDLTDVATSCYEESLDTILEWIN